MKELFKANFQWHKQINFTRFVYFIATAVVIVLGLASRRFGASLPAFVGLYVGDSLWAVAVFCAGSFLFPAVPLPGRVGMALLFAYTIEFSQLYQADWINQWRATRPGSLVLGHGFLWSDLIAYAVGIAGAAGVDYLTRTYFQPPPKD